MVALAVLDDSPGAWIEFPFDGKTLRARHDPMCMGVEAFSVILEELQNIRRVFDQDSQMKIALSDPFGSKLPGLLDAYLNAVGLSIKRLGLLLHAIDKAEKLEIDLLRMGLDIRDWFNPEGELSSRRVALIVEDLLERPESRLGADYMGILPADKSAIGIAQYISSQSEGDNLHMFLWSPEDLEKETEKRRDEAAKRARIMSRSREE